MRFLAFILCVFMLTGCGVTPTESTVAAAENTISETTAATVPEPETTAPPDPIQEMIDSMSLEERVGQLFLARCDDAVALEHISEYHLGGFVLFGRDFEGQTPESFREKIVAYQTAAKLPLLLAVDEEGGHR